MAQAGRAVLISGGTVAIGLVVLVVLPVPFMRSVGYGGLLVPLVSVLVTLTLLPVVLATIWPAPGVATPAPAADGQPGLASMGRRGGPASMGRDRGVAADPRRADRRRGRHQARRCPQHGAGEVGAPGGLVRTFGTDPLRHSERRTDADRGARPSRHVAHAAARRRCRRLRRRVHRGRPADRRVPRRRDQHRRRQGDDRPGAGCGTGCAGRAGRRPGRAREGCDRRALRSLPAPAGTPRPDHVPAAGARFPVDRCWRPRRCC